MTVNNTSRTSMTVHWENLAPLINETVLYYIANVYHGNPSRAAVLSGDLYSANFLGLSAYTEYQLNVVGINSHGQPYNSSNMTALTEGGGKWCITFRAKDITSRHATPRHATPRHATTRTKIILYFTVTRLSFLKITHTTIVTSV